MGLKERKSLPTVSGLLGGALVGASTALASGAPPVVVTFSILFLALCGFAACHACVALLDRLFRNRPVSGAKGAAIPGAAALSGAIPVLWISDGALIPSLIAAATLFTPAMAWLSSRDALQQSIEAGLSGSWKLGGVFTRDLLAPAMAAVMAVPVGLIAWVIPLALIRHYDIQIPPMFAIWTGIVPGCLVSAALGLAIGRGWRAGISRITAGHKVSVENASALTVLLWSTLSGIACQLLVFAYLKYNPPNSVQGPGPFTPPFPVAAFVAAVLSVRKPREKRNRNQSSNRHPVSQSDQDDAETRTE